MRHHRTALGVPDSPLGPTVDGTGLLTPFAHGWSVEIGVVYDGTLLTSSNALHIQQRALDGFPVIETVVAFEEGVLHLVTFAQASTVHLETSLKESARPYHNCSLVFFLRPYTRQGTAIINSVEYLPDRTGIRVNGRNLILFNAAPDHVHCFARDEEDAEAALDAGRLKRQAHAARCQKGSASSIALFHLNEPSGGPLTVRASIPLREHASPALSPMPVVLEKWKEWSAGRAEVYTPDVRLHELVRLSLPTLAMSCNGETSQPGSLDDVQKSPHAPVMALALEMFDIRGHAAGLLRSAVYIPDGPIRAGTSRSESRSDAHLARLAWHHLLLTGDRMLLEELSSPLLLRARLVLQEAKNTGRYADAGECDVWSFAELEAYTRLARLLGTPEAAQLKQQLAICRNDLPHAFTSMRKDLNARTISTSPQDRRVESLDTLCAACTLQLLDASHPSVNETIDTLLGRCLQDGMPPESDIHLVLQVAHACLLAGRRKAFAQLLSAAAAQASPTGSFAAGAFSESDGTSAGDRHPGLAAAAFVLALRDSFVFERQDPASDSYDLVFLAGLTPEWFRQGPACFLRNAPAHGGRVSVELHPAPGTCTVFCRWEHLWFAGPRHFIVELPPGIEPLECRGWISLREGVEGGTVLTLPPESLALTVRTPPAEPAMAQSTVA